MPADMVLMQTTEHTGSCFVRTDQLDGETDWKLRLAIPATQNIPMGTVSSTDDTRVIVFSHVASSFSCSKVVPMSLVLRWFKSAVGLTLSVLGFILNCRLTEYVSMQYSRFCFPFQVTRGIWLHL